MAVCARREDRLEQLAREIESSGGLCHPAVVDVANRGAVFAMVQDIVKRWGRLDVAVANAGYGLLARVEEIENEEMERIWSVNFLGTLWTIQAALPGMKEQREGHIVMISSVIGRYALPLSGAYCVTKFSQTALGQALRPELRRHNIGVTVAYPGYTATEFGERQLHKDRRKNVDRKAQPPAEVARRIVSAVRRNKKEVYPNFSGSLFAHFGLWFPWLTDQLLSWAVRRMEN
jgi:short-subunit dehydrogenase